MIEALSGVLGSLRFADWLAGWAIGFVTRKVVWWVVGCVACWADGWGARFAPEQVVLGTVFFD